MSEKEYFSELLKWMDFFHAQLDVEGSVMIGKTLNENTNASKIDNRERIGNYAQRRLNCIVFSRSGILTVSSGEASGHACHAGHE